MDDKYIVFKRDEFWTWMDKWAHRMDAADYCPEPVPDAVVLRLKDRFAAGALEAYAHGIMAALEMIQEFAVPSVVETKRLEEIAEYFFQQAADSRDMIRRTPD